MFHPNMINRQLYRFGFGFIAFLVIFLAFPMKHHIETPNKYCEAVWTEDGILLAYQNNSDKNKVDNVPVLFLDSSTINVFDDLIAREDPRLFYQNQLWGGGSPSLNFRGLSARNFNGAGGSTLSQQALKNLVNQRMLNPRKRTIYSKTGEMAGSFKMSFHYLPQEILQLYINNVSFNKHSFGGVELNCIQYFNVNDLRELNPYERYVLARSTRGLRTAGICYDSLRYWSRPKIDSLFAASYRSMLISNKRRTEADLSRMLSYPLRFRNKNLTLNDKSYFWGILKSVELQSGSPQYITSLNFQTVKATDSAFHTYSAANRDLLKKGNFVLDANAVVTDLKTGKITGCNTIPLNTSLQDTSFSIKNQLFNYRPAASLIKPLLVAAGLELNLLTEESILSDKYNGRVHNYSEKYYGPVSLATILQKSLNTPLDNFEDRKKLIDWLEEKLTLLFHDGLRKLPADKNISQYVIGESRELSAVQIAALYRALLTDGIVYEPKIVRKVLSTDQFPFDTLFSKVPAGTKIFSDRVCAIMRRLLCSPLKDGGTLNGISKLLIDSYGVKGKTGTSESWKYGWCVLADEKKLVVVSMSYFNIKKADRSSVPVPSKTGAGSAGILCAYIFNNLNNQP